MARQVFGRSERISRAPESRRGVAVTAGLVCLFLAGYLVVHQRDQSRLRTASELGLHGRYSEAQAEARRVTRPPARTHALVIQAYAAQARGRHRLAVDFFRRAVEREPRSWSLRRDLAISLRALTRTGDARRQMELANLLNPRMATPGGF